jgi:hypothetical protein
VFVSFLHGGAARASTLVPRTPDEAPPWVPPELRVFAEAPDGAMIGLVVAHPERPAQEWSVAAYRRAAGATWLGSTARQALPGLVDGFLPPEPDEIALSLLRVRLAVAPEPERPWADLAGMCRVHLPDGLELVVPKAGVDPADFRDRSGDLGQRVRDLVRRRRAGSALALCRAAAFEAFRGGDDALGVSIREEMAHACEALGRRWR